MKLLWILAFLGALVGIAIGTTGMAAAESAPQEAAVMAIAIGCAVIPYCLARAWDEARKTDS